MTSHAKHNYNGCDSDDSSRLERRRRHSEDKSRSGSHRSATTTTTRTKTTTTPRDASNSPEHTFVHRHSSKQQHSSVCRPSTERSSSLLKHDERNISINPPPPRFSRSSRKQEELVLTPASASASNNNNNDLFKNNHASQQQQNEMMFGILDNHNSTIHWDSSSSPLSVIGLNSQQQQQLAFERNHGFAPVHNYDPVVINNKRQRIGDNNNNLDASSFPTTNVSSSNNTIPWASPFSSSFGFDVFGDMMNDPVAFLEPVADIVTAVRTQQALQDELAEPVDVVPSKDAPPTFVHKNDYSQHFFDTNKRPQNFLRDSKYELGFDEYPELKRLIHLKDKLVRDRATAPMFLQCDLKTVNLTTTLKARFDVILIDPPWYEYHERAPTFAKDYWTAKEISDLKIPEIAADQCFLFLWCGSADALESGRIIMRQWGFRRCEDIVWIKTNKEVRDQDPEKDVATDLSKKGWDGHSVMTHTKEHCLVGMRGTVKRNVDCHFIHANIDTDVIVTEEPPFGVTRKPHELYTVIEHFCNGRRRLELFGETHNIRPGWLTLGNEFYRRSTFEPSKYLEQFQKPCDFPDYMGARQVADLYQNHVSGNSPNVTASDDFLLGSTSDIERDRPQSPTSRSATNASLRNRNNNLNNNNSTKR